MQWCKKNNIYYSKLINCVLIKLNDFNVLNEDLKNIYTKILNNHGFSFEITQLWIKILSESNVNI